MLVMVMFRSSCLGLCYVVGVLPILALAQCQGRGCVTREMLQVFTAFRKDNRFRYQELWDRLDTCFERFSTNDIDLWNTLDAYWSAYLDYGIAGGSADDQWIMGPENYFEENPTPLATLEDLALFPGLPPEIVNITIFEPCNTVSNIAFFRSVLAICDHDQKYGWAMDQASVFALIQAVSITGPGSIFYHSSGTKLGNIVDVESIKHMALISLQGALGGIPYDPILHDLSETPAEFSGIEAATAASRFYTNDPADEWLDQIRVLNMPRYEVSYMSIVLAVLSLSLSENLGRRVAEAVAGFLPISESFVQFGLTQYMPRLRQALEQMGVGPRLGTRLALLSQLLGVFVRILYAFFWQEETFEHKLLTSRFSNFLGAVGIRSVNSLADKLTGFDRSSDRNFKTSRNVYPGDFRCNIQEPHSKWHEVSANTIVDIMLTSDSIFKVIAGERLPLLFNHGLVHRYETHGSFAAFEWASIAPQASLVFDSCLIEAIDNWNKPNRIGGFLSCMASSIVTHAVSRLDAADGDSGSQETIETCLVANDCVRFQGFQIDLSHLKQCVGLVANNLPKPCSSHVNRPRAFICLLPCWGDVSCTIGCLKTHAGLAPWISASVSCISVLGGQADEKRRLGLMDSCSGGAVSAEDMSTFQAGIVAGLSSMATCSLDSCREEHNAFVPKFMGLIHCADECIPTDTWWNEKKEAPPAFVYCILQCVLSF